jgi:hypothetical protein
MIYKTCILVHWFVHGLGDGTLLLSLEGMCGEGVADMGVCVGGEELSGMH